MAFRVLITELLVAIGSLGAGFTALYLVFGMEGAIGGTLLAALVAGAVELAEKDII